MTISWLSTNVGRGKPGCAFPAQGQCAGAGQPGSHGTPEAMRVRYQPWVETDRNAERMGAVVDFLFTKPILSAKQLAGGVGMPSKTARQYLEKLVRAGILREVTGYARNQIYRADEIFSALDNFQD